MEPMPASIGNHLRVPPDRSKKREKRIEGFDFLRVIAIFAVIAYKTKVYYIPKIWLPGSLSTALSDYVLSGIVGALAVPVFLQISLFIFYIKSENAGLGYFLRRRLIRLVSLYLFWVILITLFDILFFHGLDSVRGAATSPKNFILLVVSGNHTPYFFFFSLIFVTIISEVLVLLFSKLRQPSIRISISYYLLIASSTLVFTFATIEPFLDYTGIQSPFLRSLNNLTGWDYNPLNFLPYIFSAVITVEEYKMGKLDKITPILKRKLSFLLILMLAFFALEWILTSHHLLIQVDQAPLDHYMRLSLVFGSWLLLYIALLIKQKPPALIGFLATCSLGIYGFHVFFIFKKSLQPAPIDRMLMHDFFQTFPLIQILAAFSITLIGSIALTLVCKRVKFLKGFV